MRKLLTTITAFVFMAGLGCNYSGAIDDSVIRIGEYSPLTGEIATFGTSTHEGIQLAIEETNAAGGVKGKQLKLITLDDRGKPEEAALAVTKLISQNKVHVILGEIASSNSLAAAPIAQRHKVPMITPSSTNPKVTEQGDYIFRVCFIDPFQGLVMAKYARKNLKKNTAAIFRDKKSDYSVGLADVFIKEFKAMGGKIVADEAYVAGDVDFKAQLTKIKAKRPDVIFVPGYYTEVGLIARQARQLGIRAPLMGGDGWDSSKLYEIGGKALNGSYFSNHYTTQSREPRVIEFIAKYKKRYNGKMPDALGTLGYDAAMVMVAALKKAKSLSHADIRDAIAATRNFPGVTGNITLDKNRNAIKPAVVLKIMDKKPMFVATIKP